VKQGKKQEPGRLVVRCKHRDVSSRWETWGGSREGGKGVLKKKRPQSPSPGIKDPISKRFGERGEGTKDLWEKKGDSVRTAQNSVGV